MESSGRRLLEDNLGKGDAISWRFLLSGIPKSERSKVLASWKSLDCDREQGLDLHVLTFVRSHASAHIPVRAVMGMRAEACEP